MEDKSIDLQRFFLMQLSLDDWIFIYNGLCLEKDKIHKLQNCYLQDSKVLNQDEVYNYLEEELLELCVKICQEHNVDYGIAELNNFLKELSPS